MKIKPMCSASGRIHARRASVAFILSLALGLLANAVSAQVVVINPTGDAGNEAGFASQLAKTVQQYTTQLQQLQQEVQQYEQLLMTVQGLGSNISFTTNQLTPITDPSSLIDQNCPGNTGGSIVSGLVTSIASSISSSQSISQSQQQLCAQITMVQIDEYNKTVDIRNQLDTYGGTLQKLNTLANQVNSLGTTSGATTQAATYSATITTAMNNWHGQMQGDEDLIKALEQQQSSLAKKALRGQNSIVGNIVQAATLEAWFAANPYRSR